MVSAVISFRASGDFLDWLQSQAASGESASQAAQRLLKAASDSFNEDVYSPVNSVDNLSPGLDLVLERLDKVEARLSQLESSPDSALEPIAESIPNSPNRQLTIFDALSEVEIPLKSSGLLDLSIEEEKNYLLREDFDKLQAEYDALLESSDHIISKLRAEVSDLRSQFESQERDRDELEEKLNQAELELMDSKSRILPDSAVLLNSLKTRRKNTRVTLADIETIFNLL
jgi:chromosome segregation ATPase